MKSTVKAKSFLLLVLVLVGLNLIPSRPVQAAGDVEASTVDTTTSNHATSMTCQRKAFYAENRYWVFYSNGSDMLYKTSLDGETWGSSNSLFHSPSGWFYGYDFSIWYNGSDVYYVRSEEVGDPELYFRQGEPQSDGSISWHDTETLIAENTSSLLMYSPQISTDANGFPQVSYMDLYDVSGGPINLTKSQVCNGSWITASGFPYKVNSTLNVWQSAVLGMSGNRSYVLYMNVGGVVNGRYWDGSSWSAEELNIDQSANFFTAVNYGDDIHLVFTDASTNNLTHVVRTFGSGWGSPVNIEPSADSDSAPVLSIDEDTGNLYVFWTESDSVYYKMYIQANEEWIGTKILWLTESNLLEHSITSFYAIYSFQLGFLFTSGSGSPYNVKFAYNPNRYTLIGPFRETTGYRDYGGVNVSIYFDSIYFDRIFLNGTAQINYPYVPRNFRYEFVSEREYWLSSDETSGTYYVFNGTLTSYQIQFLDLANVLDDYSYIEAWYNINGTDYLVERREADIENKVLMSLTNGEKYTLIIQNGATHTFGELLVTSTTSITLPIRGLTFPKETLLTYMNVRAYSHRAFDTPTGNITITYQDLLEETRSVNITIYYKNGTTQAYTAVETADSFVHQWTSAANDTDYRLVLTIIHDRYGTYEIRNYFPGDYSLSTPPFALDFLGVLPFDTSIIIPSLLIVFVAVCFSVINVHLGAFLSVIMAAFFTVIGIYVIDSGLLITAFCLAVFLAIIVAKRRLQV